MFYSETLLAKTGPLARVWLAANLERKLTKQNVLSSNLETNVKDIIGQGQAPMALRLSGQLLLGVVKIYSRKARYLLDDCNDALHKIKMAFRPGNVDLPFGQSHTANPNTLILPDAVTELDLFTALPDPEDFLRDDSDRRGPGKDPTLIDFGTSQLVSESQTPRREKRTIEFDDVDIELDFGLEPGERAIRYTPMSEERSVEIGRRAQTPRGDEPTFLDADVNMGLDFGMDGDTTIGPAGNNDMPMPDAADDGFQFVGGDDDLPPPTHDKTLSPVRPSMERDPERTFQLDPTELDDTTMIQAPQRIKRRKVMKQDSETQLHNSQIKKQQEDRSAITKAPTFLPKDPLFLQLMEMQRNGSFVSSLMGDGRMAGWAPELRGILSLEVVRRAGERKRKRDSGIADVDGEDDLPGLDIPEEEEGGFPVGPGADFGGNATLLRSDGPLLMSDGPQPPHFDDDEAGPYSPGPGFDVTEAPLLHPSQSGPVSLGTKTAVHLLREHFAPHHPKDSTEPPTPSKRVKAEALFTDLCPEARTSRQDATKMFFEMLVLGTKDAVKVEQESKGLGMPIRVRGKRGLWGSWAEMGAGSQALVEEQEV